MTAGALDSLIRRIEANRPGVGDLPKRPRQPLPADYGDYDGPGAPPPPVEEMVEGAMEVATELPTAVAPTPTQKKYPPRAKKAGKLENSTPLAAAPPYDPNGGDPQVVRLG